MVSSQESIDLMKYEETANRDLDTVTDPSTISQIIKTFLFREILIVRGEDSERKAFITKVIGDSPKIAVRFSGTISAFPEGKVCLQKVLLNYVELNCVITGELGNCEYILNVESVRIAKKNRKIERIHIKKDEVFVTNIAYTPSRMELNQFTAPNIVREVLEKFESELRHPKFGRIKVGLFENGQDQKFSVVQKIKKTFYIRNTRDPKSYEIDSPKFINYITYFGNNILSAIRMYKNESIQSELILPILFDKDKKESTPKGYIWVESKAEIIMPEDLPEIYSLSDKIINAIQNSNSIKATSRFQVLDISEAGMRLKIHEPHLIDSLFNAQSFKFDLVFKSQAPISATGNIRSRTLDKRGRLYLGVEFIKESTKSTNEKRLESNIQSLRNSNDILLEAKIS